MHLENSKTKTPENLTKAFVDVVLLRKGAFKAEDILAEMRNLGFDVSLTDVQGRLASYVTAGLVNRIQGVYIVPNSTIVLKKYYGN